MILGTILLLLCLAVAFFHYIQGLLSSFLSAVLVTFAAVIAIGMHESLAKVLVGMKWPEQAASISLVIIFAATYIILRVLFDMLIPGNVRFPAIVEKVGAGVFGLWVGLLATGILAIAAQTLPLWPTIGGYARYDVQLDRTYTIKIDNRGYDAKNDTEMIADTFDPAMQNHLWFHQDDLVLALAARQSDSGALRGDVQWSTVHPDYLTELFGQRLGLQVGAKRTIVNTDTAKVVKCTGIYTKLEFPQKDGEIAGERPSSANPPQKLLPGEGKVLLVVRLKFNGAATDIADVADGKFRFGFGNIRLCAGSSDADKPKFQDFYPVAVLRQGTAIYQRIDDFLIADTKTMPTIDFIFQVDPDVAIETDSKGIMKLRSGSFVDVKRYGIVDVSGLYVQKEIPDSPTPDAILRKPDVIKALAAPVPQ